MSVFFQRPSRRAGLWRWPEWPFNRWRWIHLSRHFFSFEIKKIFDYISTMLDTFHGVGGRLMAKKTMRTVRKLLNDWRPTHSGTGKSLRLTVRKKSGMESGGKRKYYNVARARRLLGHVASSCCRALFSCYTYFCRFPIFLAQDRTSLLCHPIDLIPDNQTEGSSGLNRPFSSSDFFCQIKRMKDNYLNRDFLKNVNYLNNFNIMTAGIFSNNLNSFL